MKFSDVKIGQRFGFVDDAKIFGRDAAAIYTKVGDYMVQMGGRDPVRMRSDDEDLVYTLEESNNEPI